MFSHSYWIQTINYLSLNYFWNTFFFFVSLPPTSLSGSVILSFSSRNSFWLFRCPVLVWKPGKNEANAFPISLMDVSLLFQVPFSWLYCCTLCWPLQHLESSMYPCPSVWFTEHTPSFPVSPGFYRHLSNLPQSFSVTLFEWQSLPRLLEVLDTFPLSQFAPLASQCLCNLKPNSLLLSSLTSCLFA